jgi:hypothetical protein
MPSKSTGLRKTGTKLEEVKEEPMVTVKTQEQQWRATVKA